MKKFILLASIVLIAAACNKQSVNPTPNPTPVNNNSAFENDNLKVTLMDGWKATAVSNNSAAVNITNGNYILYINTHASQASGVTGGRFAEIAMGAPSADAVVTVQPSPPCGTSTSTPLLVSGEPHQQVNFYVSGKDKTDFCSVPTNGSTVWYFGYITGKDNAYFNYTLGNPSLAITMSYNSKNINAFPVKDSNELNTKLSEMNSIIQSLEIKKK